MPDLKNRVSHSLFQGRIMVLFSKKQIPQLYQHLLSPKQESRNFFQKTLEQSNLKPIELGIAIREMRNQEILTLENFSIIVMHPSPLEMASALIQLHSSNLLNPENKKAIEHHAYPVGIALALRLLQTVKLLNPKNRAAIQEKDEPHSVVNVLFKLYYSNLFIQQNFDKVLDHSDLNALYNSLCIYERYNLTQILFESLIREKDCSSMANKLKKSTSLSYHASHDTHFFSSGKQDSIAELNRPYRQICKK